MDPARVPVPEAVAERARMLAAGRIRPVPARPASTVLLLRDDPGGLRVYLLRRRETMAFAAGMYAFPGGAVDPRDRAGRPPRDAPSRGAPSRDAPSRGAPGREAAGRDAPGREAAGRDAPGREAAGRDAAGRDAGGGGVEDRAWECAAARELFEETGVLLAGPSRDALVDDTTGAGFESDRRALVGKELAFSDFLTRRRLVLRTDLLVPCGHWVTPEAEPRRYDTRFYLAALPRGQRTRDVSGEADRVAWLRPADAEAAVASGEMRMLPPTAAMLAMLTPVRTVAEALATARSREVVRVQPSVVFDAGGTARWTFT